MNSRSGSTFALVLAMALTVPGCGRGDSANDKTGGLAVVGQKSQPVTVKEVVPRKVTYTVMSVGTLEAAETVSIPARVAGVVQKVNFKEGDLVTPETVLIEVDPDRYRLEVERAEADLQKATAQEMDAVQSLDQRRNLKQRDPGWVTDEELRRFQTALDAAKAERERQEANLALARKNLQDAFVKPPFRGLIDSRSVSTGAYVKAETVIASMSSVKTLKLRFTVPEVDAARINEGQAARFRVGAFPAQDFESRIFFVSSVADPQTRSVEVKARYDNQDGRLKPGYFAQVLIDVATHDQALMVPEESVIPTEMGFVCYVIDGNAARMRRVQIGLRSEGEVEILTGLNAGEKVVVRGGHTLSDGTPVQITEDGKPS